VWVEVEPSGRGVGFKFESKIRGGAVPREYITAVGKGVQDALGAGPVGGYPVVDVKVALVDGSYHEVDSSEMAFRIAASMATKAAIQRASPVLLEPIMVLEIVTPGEFLGEVLGELGRRRAKIRSIEGLGDVQAVRAHIPLAETFGYVNSLRSLTQGRASHSMEFEGYEKAPAPVAAA
jgi:elongation factor G